MKFLDKLIRFRVALLRMLRYCLLALYTWLLVGCEEQSVIMESMMQTHGVSISEVNVLMFQDSSENDHQMIQQAIDYASDNGIYNVFVPSGEYLIDAAGINGQAGILLRDSIQFRLADSASLKAIPSGASSYSILRVHDATAVKIIGGNIIGDRYEHTGISGEWGMGIDIRRSNNVKILKVNIKDCWGDGIYIAGASEQVLIDSIVSDNNRRQGMSVVDCDGLLIKNSFFINTNGKAPQSGIDLEPNVNQSVVDVEIINCHFENNSSLGLHMYGRYGPVNNVLIEDSFIDGNPIGLSLRYEGVNNVEIKNVEIINSSLQGLRIFDGARDVDMEDIEIVQSTANAVTLTDARNVSIDNIFIEDFETGIVVGNSANINISNGEVKANNMNGIGLSINGSDTLVFDYIDLLGGKDGIRSTNNTYMSFMNSKVDSFDEYGIYLSSTHNSEFTNSLFTDNRKTPIYMFNSNSNTFNNNEFVDNGFYINNNYFQINVSGGSSNNEISSNIARASTKLNKPKYVIRLSPATVSNIGNGNLFEIGSYVSAAVMDESNGSNQIN